MEQWNFKTSKGKNLTFTFKKWQKKEENITKNILFQLVWLYKNH